MMCPPCRTGLPSPPMLESCLKCHGNLFCMRGGCSLKSSALEGVFLLERKTKEGCSSFPATHHLWGFNAGSPGLGLSSLQCRGKLGMNRLNYKQLQWPGF